MRLTRSFLLSLVLGIFTAAVFSGCKDKSSFPKPANERIAAAEVERILGEARFAITLKEYPRAENLVKQAIVLDNENPSHYLALAELAIVQANKPAARSAYETAMKLLHSLAKKSPKDESIIIAIINLHVRLRQSAEAQKILDKALKDFPKSENFKTIHRERWIEQMERDPEFQQLAV